MRAAEEQYALVGRFIYGAFRSGATQQETVTWMAQAIGVAPPAPLDSGAEQLLYQTFMARHVEPGALDAALARFVAARAAPV